MFFILWTICDIKLPYVCMCVCVYLSRVKDTWKQISKGSPCCIVVSHTVVKLHPSYFLTMTMHKSSYTSVYSSKPFFLRVCRLAGRALLNACIDWVGIHVSGWFQVYLHMLLGSCGACSSYIDQQESKVLAWN